MLYTACKVATLCMMNVIPCVLDHLLVSLFLIGTLQLRADSKKGFFAVKLCYFLVIVVHLILLVVHNLSLLFDSSFHYKPSEYAA